MSQRSEQLSPNRLVLAGVRKNWRTSAAVAIGVALATAVIVGALVVGDSMRGSLRALTIERLGSIQSVVAPGGFFSAQDAASTLGVSADQVAPIILFDRAVLETSGDEATRRAGAVQAIGCDESFWSMDITGVSPRTMPDENSIVLTEALAADLGAKIGDQVTVRLPVEQAVPADSPLGRRDVQTEGIPRLEVVDIIPDRGLARFSLAPAQATPKNVFLSRDLVADVLQREGQANVALSASPVDPGKLSVSLADLGLKLRRITKTFEDQTIFDYFSVASDRLLVDPNATEAIRSALPPDSVTEAMTYLANALERVDADGKITHSVPYSTITAIDSSPDLPLEYTGTEIPDGVVPMVLNSWTAERLDADVGTPLRIAYFEPEVENGNEIERTFPAVVTAVVPITEPIKRYFRSRAAVFDAPPTRYNDPDLTPTVPGVTDQESMLDWNLPFQLTRKVDPATDDVYWNNHRLTPKAFLPLADGQRLFGSRFGKSTGLLIDPNKAGPLDQVERRVMEATHEILPELGWHVRSIRDNQLAASSGTTPFDGLFLALSFFVIFAAVMLIAMLFRLGLVSRSREIGTLIAIGWDTSGVRRLFLGEGALIAGIGSVLGVAGGVAYATFVLAALRTFWVGAVTVPFLTFHANSISLVGGALIGFLIGMAALWWTLRSLLASPAVALLSGRTDSDQVPTTTAGHIGWLRWAAVGLLVMALGAAAAGAMAGGQTAAGGFVGGGMLLLISLLVLVYDSLRRRTSVANRKTDVDGYSLVSLARSNGARAPLRSTLTVGLMATASFLIVAITAFRLQPTDEGTGRFDLVVETAQPLYEDLSDPDVRQGLLGTDADLIGQATIVSWQVRSGQDASCNNLYQASEPTVFGIAPSVSQHLSAFHFYAAGTSDDPNQTAWDLLARQAKGSEDDPIPVIIDQNTAMWSLKMMKGIGEVKAFTYDNETLHFEVVGLLENSLLQGRLIIGEDNFHACFPDISGYRYLLLAAPDGKAQAIADALESRLGDNGLDASNAGEVLSGMMAVQNTYLRTFQSLGGLGLLLGTLGLAIAQLRNVLERRGELAVMRAIGFTPGRLAALVLGETTSSLLLGIGCGVVCAVLCVLPHSLASGLTPPIVEPLLLIVGIIAFGMLAGLLAAARVIRMPLVDSLRGS